ncbi:GNAT family N-acetyltransferase [Phenylobacterium sp.]|jgi:GNAT superfamily N-acetyltransferase|uniref:GNAT family N-acetyltransferase n=1 Tax=Phenylobacterium sp. TaxID=1871053 RepID=UPI001201E91D|nr:GNAT family N-acetyltransferase [Phenylobacterium sp.]THD53538.1 MAG: GNAT family N-acetyltransferase [Phenylobacterium sp.]
MATAPKITIRPARREDVAAIVALLADDGLGAGREAVSDPPLPAYLDAFDKIAANPRALLAVAEDGAARAVGTLQLTFIAGLSNQGAEQALVSAVRIASDLRGRGLGEVLMQWAMDEARRRGCKQMELLSDTSRTDAHRFYERLGFERSHVGMKRAL